ncbi:hypothetical protein SAMN05444487_106173 [Marininema mesophilum]|uniref:Endospore appendages core domain-containing protein n=1 Tax=Marininema mesophilum TaxID=1048340 RepID=A0A1H2WLP2_9BACL|nr:S-Ena type endospore appendage [Marininema mesophilum]SDW81485.1 hypothetical protein SAMN05444487_106173 [Marininema mesophilum]
MSCCSSRATCPDPTRFQEEICGNFSTDLGTDNTVWKSYTSSGSTPGPFYVMTLNVYADTTSFPVVVEVVTPAGLIILTPPASEIAAGTTKSFTLLSVNAVNIHAIAGGQRITGKYSITLYRNIF